MVGVGRGVLVDVGMGVGAGGIVAVGEAILVGTGEAVGSGDGCAWQLVAVTTTSARRRVMQRDGRDLISIRFLL